MAKKILVVDDDPVGSTIMKARLSGAGFEVLTAIDGMHGLEAVREHHPDLIILDIEMPTMNGYVFILEMKQDSSISSIPVMVLTSHEENKPIFRRKGILHYLVKPVNFDDLFAHMKELIGE